jgi:thiamine biosynthesis lipoprotein ApbE
MNPRILIAFPLAILLAACGQSGPLHTDSVFFGTRVSLDIRANSSAAAGKARDEILAELKTLQGILPPASSKPMMRTNLLMESGEWFSVNPSIYRLIVQSQDYYRRTGGRFNPALLGGLKQLHATHSARKEGSTPEPTALAKLHQAAPSMDDIDIDGIRMRNRNPHLRLDFGLLIYGYAADAEIEHLRALGIHDARLSVGPVTRVLGSNGSRPWTVAPTQSGPQFHLGDGQAACVLDGRDSTYQDDLLDLHTGAPASGTASAIVVAGTASEATAACSVLFVGGPEAWNAVTRGLGLKAAQLRTSDGRVLTGAALKDLSEGHENGGQKG